MKKILIAALTTFMGIWVHDLSAQSNDEKQKIKEMVEDQAFVIDANMLYDRNNSQHLVQSPNNFILVKGDTMVIQTATPNRMGLNGLGGFTAHCNITSWEVLQSKKDFISVRAQINSNLLGQGTINFTVSSMNNARAQFVGNFGQRFMFQGDLETLEESDHFRGFAY